MLFFFTGKTYNGAFRYAQNNLGVKTFSAPSKNPKKCPIICFALDKKKLISKTFKIRVTLVFLCPKERKREREKERERERARGRERLREREKKEKERENKRVGNYIYKPPGPVKNLGTIQYCM
jgi:hypothetical protein